MAWRVAVGARQPWPGASPAAVVTHVEVAVTAAVCLAVWNSLVFL